MPARRKSEEMLVIIKKMIDARIEDQLNEASQKFAHQDYHKGRADAFMVAMEIVTEVLSRR